MQLTIQALPPLPPISQGDNLVDLLFTATAGDGIDLTGGEIVVVAHKAASKAEGNVVDLRSIHPTPDAVNLAARVHRDPRMVQVVLDQSAEIIRADHVIISRTHHGFICANAGVDQSNCGEDEAVLLPKDPDASAKAIRDKLQHTSGASLAVVIADTFGRPWRLGQTDVCIGCAGITVLDNWQGRVDSRGRLLHATSIAVVDAVAAAADLARSKDSDQPLVLIRGLQKFVIEEDGPGAKALIRPESEDLFR